MFVYLKLLIICKGGCKDNYFESFSDDNCFSVFLHMCFTQILDVTFCYYSSISRRVSFIREDLIIPVPIPVYEGNNSS